MRLNDTFRKITLKAATILLPVCACFLVVSLTLALVGDVRLPALLVPIVCLVSGALFWYASLAIRVRGSFYFMAFVLSLTGVFMLIVDTRLCSVPLPTLWPIFMPIIGLSFIGSSLCRHKRLRVGTLVPALAFCFLGVVFFLFSAHLVPFSLRNTMIVAFPLVFLPSAITILVWLATRKPRSARPGTASGQHGPGDD
jgi:hypothetical protein